MRVPSGRRLSRAVTQAPLSSNPPRRRALIAGGGIAGLTAALALGRAQWSVLVFEAAPMLEAVGAGIQLGPNAVRVLDALGVTPHLRDYAVEPNSLQARAMADGRELLAMPLGAAARERWGARFLVVHRGDLQNALIASTVALDDFALVPDRRLVAASAAGSEITARFLEAAGHTHSAVGQCLIGADGLWSATRGLIGLEDRPQPSGFTAWRALAPRDTVPLFAREPNVSLWLGATAHVVHYPVRGGRDINIVLVEKHGESAEGWSRPGDVDAIRARARNWHPPLRDVIQAPEEWRGWSLFDRPSRAGWHRDAMGVIGDAAHPMLPFLGQGGAQAIEDAAALGATLGRTDTPVAAAWATFEQVRFQRAADVQRESRKNGRMYHLDGPAAAARDLALAFLGGRGMQARFDWLYGHQA